jgi:hypothetical protein
MQFFSFSLRDFGGGFKIARSLVALAVGLLLLYSPSGLRAQALSGIQGTVTDASGLAVPDATVTVTNSATGVTSHAVTSSSGTFTVTDLIPGPYTVKIEKAGFQSAVITGINVEAGGKQASVDTALKTASVKGETIEIVADPITLETSTPDLGTAIETKLVDEVPVGLGNVGGVGGRGRQIDHYLFLAPGVTGGAFSHRINGGLDFQNEIVFNGVAVPQAETQGFQSNINPPFEMVSEIRVLSSVFSAQYGLAQGVAAYQFASGTNTLHGDAFEVLRNSYFDAPGAAAAFNGPVRTATNKITPTDKENNFGFSVGGPVYLPKLYNGKDRTFFHVSLDWYRQQSPVGGNTFTVPTAAMKQGDFSDPSLTAATNIYVPGNFVAPAGCLNNGAAPVPGKQWFGNKIPQACWSQTALKYIALIPDPTVAGSGSYAQGSNANSQLSNIATKETRWGFSIDHHLTDKQNLHGTFWRNKYNTPAPLDDGSVLFSATSPISGLKNEPRLGTGLFLSYSNAISSNLVVTAGIGWMGEINNELSANLDAFPSGAPGVANSHTSPYIQINDSNFSSMALGDAGSGGQGETNSINRKLGVSLANNWLWVRGRHTLNFGADIRRTFQDDHECIGCAGKLVFSHNGTAQPGNVSSTGIGFASFLLGQVDQASRQFSAETKLRNLYIAPYVQDNFKITSKLTVDVGLRWDILKPFTTTAVNGQPANTVVFFNPGAPNPAAISTIPSSRSASVFLPLQGAVSLLGTCPNCSGYDSANIHWRNFSPRLGVAYRLNYKTSILAGFALNHLDGGAYEYGNNKIANQYGQFLNGFFSLPSSGTNTANGGQWDSNPLASPAASPFSPTLRNGPVSNSTNYFSSDPGPYPYSQQWNFGIQRELPQNFLLSVSYVGNRAVHLPSMMNPINQMNPRYLAQFCPTANEHDPNCFLAPDSPSFGWDSSASQAALSSVGFGRITYGTTPGPGVVVCPTGSMGAGTTGTFVVPYNNFACDWGLSSVNNTGLNQALLPYPQFAASESCGGLCNPYDMSGTSLYNALQVQGQKRFSSGLSFLVSYTLSKNMSNTDSGFASFNNGSLNGFNQKSEWTVSNNDRTHVLTIAPVYELPIGPGKKFLNHGGIVVKNIVGGWQLSGVFNYASGTPFSISSNFDPLLNGFNRANLISTVPISVNWNNYYKSSPKFFVPVFTQGAFSDAGFAPGNSPRNISQLREPFSGNENLAFAKHFFFGERVSAELRMEFFNVLNRMQVCGSGSTNTNVDSGPLAGGRAAGLTTRLGVVSRGNTCQGNSPRQGEAYFRVRF